MEYLVLSQTTLQANNLAEINEKDLLQLKVTMDDFQYALGEVKPAFGVAEDEFADCLVNGIVNWGPDVQVCALATACVGPFSPTCALSAHSGRRQAVRRASAQQSAYAAGVCSSGGYAPDHLRLPCMKYAYNTCATTRTFWRGQDCAGRDHCHALRLSVHQAREPRGLCRHERYCQVQRHHQGAGLAAGTTYELGMLKIVFSTRCRSLTMRTSRRWASSSSTTLSAF